MNVVEQKLWEKLRNAAQGVRGERFTRIETSTVDGVSDVEYVTAQWHGWIELKVSHTPTLKPPYVLGSTFTLDQSRWLLEHHRPHRGLRSWLLIGFASTRASRWREFLLLDARLAFRVIVLAGGDKEERGLSRCRHTRIESVLNTVRGKDET